MPYCTFCERSVWIYIWKLHLWDMWPSMAHPLTFADENTFCLFHTSHWSSLERQNLHKKWTKQDFSPSSWNSFSQNIRCWGGGLATSLTHWDLRGSEMLVAFDSTGVSDCFLTADQLLVPGRPVLIEELSVLVPDKGCRVFSQRTAGAANQCY